MQVYMNIKKESGCLRVETVPVAVLWFFCVLCELLAAGGDVAASVLHRAVQILQEVLCVFVHFFLTSCLYKCKQVVKLLLFIYFLWMNLLVSVVKQQRLHCRTEASGSCVKSVCVL